jgi:D-arginine dehydrogenase
METYDIILVGGGIAGASAAAELASLGRVLLLEREDAPGYHSTGRSAALYTQTYGPPEIRALTVASRAFFDAAVASGFAENPVLTPRGVLLVARPDQEDALAAAHAEARRVAPTVERLGAEETLRRAPMLRPGYAAGCVWEPDATDMDVHAIHAGYLRLFRRRGGAVRTGAELVSAGRKGTSWAVRTRAGEFEAPVLVDAAGAWADEVARLAGLGPLGIVPRRRTVVTFDPDPPVPAERMAVWPMIIDVEERFYFKPEAGRVLASPADETETAPCDARPEELDVAEAVERVTAAVFGVRRIAHRWAGLRSFAPDGVPAIGFDPRAEGFFWLAGQGGYGIQTAPAMARLAAGLIGAAAPETTALGVDPAALAPGRLLGQEPMRT